MIKLNDLYLGQFLFCKNGEIAILKEIKETIIVVEYNGKNYVRPKSIIGDRLYRNYGELVKETINDVEINNFKYHNYYNDYNSDYNWNIRRYRNKNEEILKYLRDTIEKHLNNTKYFNEIIQLLNKCNHYDITNDNLKLIQQLFNHLNNEKKSNNYIKYLVKEFLNNIERITITNINSLRSSLIYNKEVRNSIRIGINSKVKILYLKENKVEEYILRSAEYEEKTGTCELKLKNFPSNNEISTDSPLGKSIIGAKKGDTVKVTIYSNKSEYYVKILDIYFIN